MPQLCILFYANYTILAIQRGSHGRMPSPPKYVPASIIRIDAVELIVRKYLLLWWSACVLEVIFYSLI